MLTQRALLPVLLVGDLKLGVAEAHESTEADVSSLEATTLLELSIQVFVDICAARRLHIIDLDACGGPSHDRMSWRDERILDPEVHPLRVFSTALYGDEPWSLRRARA